MPLKETLTRLAAMRTTELPLVSAFVDLSPELEAGTRSYGGGDDEAPLKSYRRTEQSERGPVRPGITRMRDLLREKQEMLPDHTLERESYDADMQRIYEFLENGQFDDGVRGLAIFCCSAEDIWDVEELPAPIETRLHIGTTPFLYPLLQLDQEQERFALCIADSHTARVYVVSLGAPEYEEEVQGDKINRTMKGGWSQKRIQNRIDNAVSNHFQQVAERLERIVFAEDINRIVLAGDEIAYTEFKKFLSERAWERVVGMEHLDIRVPRDEAIHRALEAVHQAEKDEGRDLARQARDEVMAGDLGAAGGKAVRYALEQGAVNLLLMHPNYGDEETREKLSEMALQTAADVEFVEDSEDLKRMGGVAAILRWRPDDLPVPKVVADMADERDTSVAPGKGAE